MWHYRSVMSNASWRCRLISNLSNWLVQEGPLEQVGCECCTQLNCTADNYQICERRLNAFERAKAHRQSDSPPESTMRLSHHAVEAAQRSGTDD